MSLRSVPKIALCRYCGTMTMWYRPYHRTWLWLCHSRMMGFLLCMALAGPWWEKPYLSSPINAGTAEPFRVSPPEAVAYPLELKGFVPHGVLLARHTPPEPKPFTKVGHHDSTASSTHRGLRRNSRR